MKEKATVLRVFSLVLLIFLTPGRAADKTAAPGSAEHLRVFEEYLKAFNAGDATGLTKFATDHLSDKESQGRPAERFVESEIRFRNVVGGGMDLYKVEKNSKNELTVTLKSHGEFPHFARAIWTFDADRPDLILSRKLNRIETPAEALPPKQSDELLAKELDAKLLKLAAVDKFSGAVLIAKEGRPIWQKAYGYADRESKTLNNLETRFRLGSMNKMLTSVAIAQLVQSGKMKYSDTLAGVLPDYPDKEIAKKITLHHLLTHTSGLGDIFGPEFQQKKDSLRDLKDYLALFAGKPLRFEPGQSWSYSNAGFVVLGLIIEKISGQSYYDYIQQHIYDVVGMRSSGSVAKTEKVPNLAVGYMRPGPNAPLTANWDTLPWRGMSAGGGDSTLGDLLRFDQALRHHKLLNPELTETVITGKVAPSPQMSSKYAYGFEDSRIYGHRIAGHGGGAPGMNAQLDMYWDNGYTVVVLANLDPPAAQEVANYIRQRLK